jgi:hypothetical protein
MKQLKYLIVGFPPSIYKYINDNNLDKDGCIAVCSLRYIAEYSKYLLENKITDIQYIKTHDATCMEDFDAIEKVVDMLIDNKVLKEV